MTPSPAPTVHEPPKTRSLGSKIFIGCLVTLFAMGLAIVVLLVVGGLWVFTPGKQVTPAQLVARDAEALVRFDNLGGDAGFKALATRFVTEAQAVQQRDEQDRLPESMRWLEGFRQMQNAQGAAGVGNALGMYLPREAVLSFERTGEGGGLEPLFVANFQRFVRPVRFFLERMVADSPRTGSETYRGRKLLDLDNGPAMTFEGGTLLVAGKLETLKRALDRLEGPTAAHPLLDQIDSSSGWDVAGLATSPDSTLAVLSALGLVSFDDPDPFAELSGLRWGLDAVSGDDARGELRFDYPSAEAAALALPLLEARWGGVAERFAAHELTVIAQTTQQGATLTTQLDLTGFPAVFRRWLAKKEVEEAEPSFEEEGDEDAQVEEVQGAEL